MTRSRIPGPLGMGFNRPTRQAGSGGGNVVVVPGVLGASPSAPGRAPTAAKLTVARLYTTESGTYSRFELSVDGFVVVSGYGLEPVGNGGLGLDRVAPGTYELILENSHRFGPDTLTVKSAIAEGSGRKMVAVRIHAGNSPADTEGCYVPGKELLFDRVTGSRSALAAIRAALLAPTLKTREITYVNPFGSRWYVPGGKR